MESEKGFRGLPINIGTGIETTINDITGFVGGQVQHIDNPRPYEELRKCANIMQAKLHLGWEPIINIEDGIAELKQCIS